MIFRYAYDPADPKHNYRGGVLKDPDHPDKVRSQTARKDLKAPASYEDLYLLIVNVVERVVRQRVCELSVVLAVAMTQIIRW